MNQFIFLTINSCFIQQLWKTNLIDLTHIYPTIPFYPKKVKRPYQKKFPWMQLDWVLHKIWVSSISTDLHINIYHSSF